MSDSSAMTQPFQIGVGLGSSDPTRLRRLATIGDGAGLSFLSVGDNPGHLLETYVSLTVLEESTEHCRIGTSVTNPGTRHPLVVASALSSLDALAPGRVFLGIATGRSRSPARIDELRSHIVALRELWSIGTTNFRGETLTLAWDARPVPILVGAAGPRALRLAGELGDGAIIETGVTPDVMEQALAHIAEGARAGGRDPAALELWWYLKSSIALSEDEAVELAVPGLAASAALVLGRDPDRHRVPERFHAACRHAAAHYDLGRHISAGADDPNRQLVSDPDLLAYLLDRYGCVGTPGTWVDRLRQLRERGVQRLFCAAVVPNLDFFLEAAGHALTDVNSAAAPAG